MSLFLFFNLGLDFGAKLNDTESLSTLDEFEKTGLISDLLLEVRTILLVYVLDCFYSFCACIGRDSVLKR